VKAMWNFASRALFDGSGSWREILSERYMNGADFVRCRIASNGEHFGAFRIHRQSFWIANAACEKFAVSLIRNIQREVVQQAAQDGAGCIALDEKRIDPRRHFFVFGSKFKV
jgi:hypothetical protein